MRIAKVNQLTESVDPLPDQPFGHQRPEPQTHGVIERRGSGRQGRRLLDHAQGDRGQLRAAVLFDRRFQVRRERGRAVAQRELHQVIEHRAQIARERLRRRRVRGRVRIVVTAGDDACVDALHEGAQRGEIGAGVGPRGRQFELLLAIGDGTLLWSENGLKADDYERVRAVNQNTAILGIKTLSDNNNYQISLVDSLVFSQKQSLCSAKTRGRYTLRSVGLQRQQKSSFGWRTTRPHTAGAPHKHGDCYVATCP